MGNDALNSNPPTGASQHITTHGSDWLWAVFAIMLFTDLVVIGWHFMIPRGQRVFHQLCAIILTTASIAYFTMASDLGFANIATEFGSEGFPAGVYRQIWYTRYIDWVVTTPALLLTLVLTSGLPLSDVITLVFFDLVMIITGLIGALVVSAYKWGFFVFAMFALFYIWWVLAGPARTTALAIGKDFQRTFTISAAILSFLWLLYPIAWGLADGGNVISPDSEMVFYGILDVLAKPVYCLYHLWALSKLDLTALQLRSGKFSTGVDYDAEKVPRHSSATGRTATEPQYTMHTNNATPPFPTPASAKKTKVFARKGKSDAPAAGAGTGSAIGQGSTGVAGTTRREEQLGAPASVTSARS